MLQMEETPDIVPYEQAAVIFNKGADTVRKWVARGWITKHKSKNRLDRRGYVSISEIREKVFGEGRQDS